MDLFLESRIFEWSFDDFRWQIENASANEINVYIAGIGGNVDAGFAIANYIQAVNASGSKKISTHILSNADSVMTVIFLGADAGDRSIVRSSTMFIHEPRFMWLEDVTAELAEQASEQLKVNEKRIADYYVSRIEGLSYDEAVGLMKGEITLDAEKMLELGIVSEIKESFSIAAIKSKKQNMSLFGKKSEKPLQTVALKQGDNEVTAIHRDEIAENTELEAVGVNDPLNGEFISGDKKITVENNKVKAVEAVTEKAGVSEEIQTAINEAVSPVIELVEKLSDKIVALKGEKTTHKPSKGGPSNERKIDDPQIEAKRNSRERQIENAKRVKNMRQKHGLI